MEEDRGCPAATLSSVSRFGPPSTTAEVLIAGARDGTILDRSGKPYKPSTALGYEQMLRCHIMPVLSQRKLSGVQRRDLSDFAHDLHAQGLSPSTVNNILDPLRVIFRRAIGQDEIAIDPTNDLDLPAIRGRRDRIEPRERAHELLAVLPTSERAFWSVALFCGLLRGEPRGLQWLNVDFDVGVIRVERSWDPLLGGKVKGPGDRRDAASRTDAGLIHRAESARVGVGFRYKPSKAARHRADQLSRSDRLAAQGCSRVLGALPSTRTGARGPPAPIAGRGPHQLHPQLLADSYWLRDSTRIGVPDNARVRRHERL